MSLLDLKVPTIGESITEVTLSKWLKPNGAFVKLDEALCEFESDKATLEFPSEAAGTLIHIAKEGDDLAIGSIVAQIDTAGVELVEKQALKDLSKPALQEFKESHYAAGLPSPSAAKLLHESGLQADSIKGTGKEGRITKEDAILAITNKQNEIQEEIKTADTLLSKDSIVKASRSSRREKLSRMRKTIAKRLVAVKNETAMLTTFNEVDMSAIVELRSKYNDLYQSRYGIKIGFMSLFAKAASSVLLQMPEVNAHLDGEEIVYHDYVDISLAISTPNGLVVPPIKNVESLKLFEFELQLKVLAEKARTGKLSLDEMTGGTFTITNGGVFGSLLSTPIINEPQSAILGMHAIKDRPVVVNGQIVIRPMMYIALSYDHRVIDGSSSVSFLVKVKELLEDPIKLFLEI
ncbi:MAG: 2-oxoglutarate dehydrogenase complex dihydrolipoyllysine-residue succinyltransferase [Saprospiraceae bacterium]